MKFIANVISQSKQKEKIEIDAKNKGLAVLKLKKEGYLILEMKEVFKGDEITLKLEGEPIWTESYIQNMKYFVGILLVISFIFSIVSKEQHVKSGNYITASNSPVTVEKDNKTSYPPSSLKSKPKKNINNIKYKRQIVRRGEINYSLVSTLKTSWQAEGWKYKPQVEQSKAIALIIGLVRVDSKSPEDTKATLDYIEDNIPYW